MEKKNTWVREEKVMKNRNRAIQKERKRMEILNKK